VRRSRKCEERGSRNEEESFQLKTRKSPFPPPFAKRERGGFHFSHDGSRLSTPGAHPVNVRNHVWFVPYRADPRSGSGRQRRSGEVLSLFSSSLRHFYSSLVPCPLFFTGHWPLVTAFQAVSFPASASPPGPRPGGFSFRPWRRLLPRGLSWKLPRRHRCPPTPSFLRRCRC
jgi:hypothetical protein